MPKKIRVSVKSFIEEIRSAVDDAYQKLVSGSDILDNYFEEISFEYTERNVKNLLRFAVLISVCVISHGVLCRAGQLYPVMRGILMLLIFQIVYYINLGFAAIERQTLVSGVVIFSIIVSHLVSYVDLSEMHEALYSPLLQIITLMYASMPMRLPMCLAISILYCTIHQLFTYLRFYHATTLTIMCQTYENATFNTLEKLNHLPELRSQVDEMYFMIGQTFLWIALHIMAFYLHIINKLRRRSSFLGLGNTVQAKTKIKTSLLNQERWIEAIMPQAVKKEYMEHFSKPGDDWIYIKPFENVSILFADIVGFTKMSSSCTAVEVVTKLNDLFNRFDKECLAVGCEKLGTLGDCYYCVAGCPEPRVDHAAACVEMGLEMCRIIEVFNSDYDTTINMRVGIHSGRVNAAILGNIRFRFDAYSYDVVIANELESTGEAGRVHISQTTYEEVRSFYEFEPGELVSIKKEEQYGLGGKLLKTAEIKTYFVRSKEIHRSLFEKHRRQTDAKLKIFNSEKNKELRRSIDAESEVDIFGEAENFQSNLEVTSENNKKSMLVSKDLAFIRALKNAPEVQNVLFKHPPINNWLLYFTNKELEWQFLYNPQAQMSALKFDSVRVAYVLDSLVAGMYIFFVCVAASFMLPQRLKVIKTILACSPFYFSIVLLALFQLFAFRYANIGNKFRLFRSFLAHPFSKMILIVLQATSPTVMFFALYMSDCTLDDQEAYHHIVGFLSIELFCLAGQGIFTSSTIIARLLSASIPLSFCCYLVFVRSCFSRIMSGPKLCKELLFSNEFVFMFRILIIAVMHFVLTWTMTVMVNFENERNMRLCFFVSREAAIGKDEYVHAVSESKRLLFNIIPEYVFKDITKQNVSKGSNTFGYAASIHKSGVVFASISNFIATFYREDYKGGAAALKLLHKIIIMFDNMLALRKYKSLEKIKTINDCYMLASGLNHDLISKDQSIPKHEVALMYFAFEMIEQLATFNEKYIVGTDHFKIKIGYNIGPVTTGIIGQTKPMFDIWGDTVNVSSRMYSTGESGEIQVPKHVKQELSKYFRFRYRGKIFVKGKGDMKTYLVRKRKGSSLSDV